MGVIKSMIKIFGASNAETPAKPRDMGRNEPCWCGSGRKYKKCHMPEDLKKAAEKNACSISCGPT